MSRRSHTQSDCYRVNFIHLQENHVAHCSTILFYYFPQKMFVMYIRSGFAKRKYEKKRDVKKKDGKSIKKKDAMKICLSPLL